MTSWQLKAGGVVAASLIALITMTACTASVGSASTPTQAAPASGECGDSPMGLAQAAYWYGRVAADLDRVELPMPDCIEEGPAGDITVLWSISDRAFVDTVMNAFEEAQWYVTRKTSESVSFENDYGTVAAVFYSRFDYANSESPHITLVYVP